MRAAHDAQAEAEVARARVNHLAGSPAPPTPLGGRVGEVMVAEQTAVRATRPRGVGRRNPSGLHRPGVFSNDDVLYAPSSGRARCALPFGRPF